MKSLLLLLTLLPTAVSASSLGVFFDPHGESSNRSADPFQPIQWYVVAQDLVADIHAYEFAFEAGADLTVTSRLLAHPNAINIGSGDNFVVGVGSCVSGGGTLLLVSFQGMLLSDAQDVVLLVRESTPSSLDFGPPAPAYARCTGEVEAFDNSSAAALNTDPQSWGQLKTQYGN